MKPIAAAIRQVAYNAEHGIKPTIDYQAGRGHHGGRLSIAKIEQAQGRRWPKSKYEVLSPEQLLKRAAKLEKAMLKAARDLEFETAAKAP